MAISEVMEPGAVPHDDLPSIHLGDELRALVTITAHPEVLDDPDGRTWRGGDQGEGNGALSFNLASIS